MLLRIFSREMKKQGHKSEQATQPAAGSKPTQKQEHNSEQATQPAIESKSTQKAKPKGQQPPEPPQTKRGQKVSGTL